MMAKLPSEITNALDLPEIQVESRRVMRPWPRADQEPKREETATLIVAGRKFEDWGTVWLQHNLTDSYAQFRFTCAERDPIPQWTSAGCARCRTVRSRGRVPGSIRIGRPT
jgi:hypothetical protein